jgi:serine/threonine protein kinase
MSESKSGNKSKQRDEEKGGGWDHIDFDEIEIGERIGGGGVGIVYNGWFKGQPVALKTLFDNRIGEDLKREYMDELLVMSKVHHSNIVDFLGACMTPPNLCFVMEMCDCSLYTLLHVDRVSFAERECVTMATDIASAMEYLHSQKPCIIHRDLKSMNVLRSSSGSLKICDFGLVMNKNTTAGTPAYMAPELVENR